MTYFSACNLPSRPMCNQNTIPTSVYCSKIIILNAVFRTMSSVVGFSVSRVGLLGFIVTMEVCNN